MKKSSIILLIVSILFSLQNSFSQTLQITYVEANRNTNPYLYIYLQALDIEGKPFININEKEKLTIKEEKNGITEIADIYSIEPLNESVSTVNFLILIDRSGSMSGQKLQDAKDAVLAAVNSELPDSSILFSYFSNDISNTLLLTKANFSTIVTPITAVDSTKFYEALLQKMNELQGKQGRKVIIALTDGIDNKSSTSSKNDFLNQIKTTDISIFTIALGSDAKNDTLQKIVDWTPNPDDKYYYSPTSSMLSSIYSDIANRVASEFLIKVIPPFKEFEGIKRNLTAEYNFNDNNLYTNYTYTFGSATDKFTFDETFEIRYTTTNNAVWIGFVILFCLLVLFVFVVPLFRKLIFDFKYIHTYKSIKPADPKVTEVCYFCKVQFKDNDTVVTKCSHRLHLNCWNYKKKYKCPDYPTNCKTGVGSNVYTIDFFTQNDYNKHLNWIWFGALGTFIAWFFFSQIINENPSNWYFDLLKKLESVFKSNSQTFYSLYTETITGVFLGSFLALILSIVEEINRGFSKLSVPRIFLRTVLGFILGFIIFFIEGVLFLELFNYQFIGTAISWIFFGTLLGFILTLFSQVSPKNGLIAGLIASSISFVFFYILNSIFVNSQESKMFSFLLFGLIYSFIVSVVVNSLQHFWLSNTKNNKRIEIENDLKTHKNIYIDFETCFTHSSLDSIKNHQYCILEFRKIEQAVYLIKSNKNDISINNRTFDKDIKLNDGDILTISKTSLKYHEKRK